MVWTLVPAMEAASMPVQVVQLLSVSTTEDTVTWWSLITETA